MRALVFRTLAIGALTFAVATDASAQAVLNQWDFNGLTTATYRQPSAGSILSGTIGGYGTSGAPSAPLASTVVNGVASDPGTVVTGTTYNRSVTVSLPATSVANASTGITFLAPTTGVGSSIQLSWSQTVGFRSSRYWQIFVSKTGTAGPFVVPTGGTGSVTTQAITGLNSGTGAISGTATVTVGSDGVIDFRTMDGNWISQGVTTTGTLTSPLPAGWVENITFTLPNGQGYQDNPNFAFAISGIWDPNNTYVSGTTGLLSSFAGTDSTNGTTGYATSASSGGGMRLDLVTVSAVPEPSTLAMLGTAAMVGGSAVWRRRRRRAAA